jgi:chemotaxis protein CheC
MSVEALTFDEKLSGLLTTLAGEGIHQAASGLSDMLGESVLVVEPRVRLVRLSDIPALLGGPESEAVGLYLQAQGGLPGQIMLVVPYPKALELADLLMELPPGTTRQLGPMERSALAEVGNLTSSFFLNAVATRLGQDIRPTPPAVMVDMVGAILDVIVAVSGGVGEHVLMLEGAFQRQNRGVDVTFWVIPDPAALKPFAEVSGLHAG